MSACGVLLGVLGWIGSLWLSLVGVQVVQLVYPPLKVGQEYSLGKVEAPGWEVAGQLPLGIMRGSILNQVGFCVAAWNMAGAWA